MKNKFILFAIFLLALAADGFAKVIDQQMAHRVAARFVSSQSLSRAAGILSFGWNSFSLDEESRGVGDPSYYVFNLGRDQGFVIISAEDSAYPVLGYSFEHGLGEPEGLPVQLKEWLRSASQAIQRLRKKDVVPTSEVRSMWSRGEFGRPVVVLKTALWDQPFPFNGECPYDGDRRSLVGCTSVAFAIVMRYHKWPEMGRGTTERYITSSKGIQVEERSLDHPYDWDAMPLDFYEAHDEHQTQEVAVLMADVACAVQADFTDSSTAAYLNVNAIKQHFGYHSDMSLIFRSRYDENTWTHIVENEIAALRPVMYSGHDYSRDSGHAFVLDGFTTDHFFHVNWGWGGNANGYFSLSGLSPYEDYDYNGYQYMILNFKPSKETSGMSDWIRFVYPGLEIAKEQFEVNVDFEVDKLNFTNQKNVDFYGSVVGAHTDRNGIIKSFITEEQELKLRAYDRAAFRSIKARLTQPIQIGDRIRFFYKPRNKEEWKLIQGVDEKAKWEVLIADEFYIHECTSFGFNKTKNQIVVTTKPGVSLMLKDVHQHLLTDCVSFVDGAFTIDTRQMKPGKFTLILQKKEDRKEVTFELKSLYHEN